MQDRGGDPRAEARRGIDEGDEGGIAPPVPDAEDNVLLDLLARWDELYRRDAEATPDSLGVDDPDLIRALRERIERQKRLYAFLELSPSGELAESGDGPAESAAGSSDAPVDPGRPAGPGQGPDPAEPSTIGRYRVLRVLGEGGFGRVYLAHDGDLRRDVAVKVPFAGDASRFLDVESYLREARIVARLSHPNIVPVYDVGRTDDGRCFIVSKYMDGGDLKARLGRSQYPFAESAGLIAVLCDALHYTHTQDLFHRDIKPANILIDATGAPSLSDFGLALRDEDVGRGAGYLGTAAYMSPEQARGEGHRVDGRSDIFSMGVVLYELLTGRRPFRGGSNREVMEQVIAAEPRPPRQINDAIPGELERICLKALAKRASERYSTAHDMAGDLRHFLDAISWAAQTAEPPPIAPTAREQTPPPAARASDSGSRPIMIVPKGLGSFDEQDADFFLELLPGPRDRDGLPDTLRFWKTRIEAIDPERAFRVGLIYGPSGCGKSSLVKAGLLPRLGPQVCAVYVEATGAELEGRLLRSLRRLFPGLPTGGGLTEALRVLRRGRGLAGGRRVLLVLDQFEQWLFARGGDGGGELVAALRQCDGERVQALCLVRDDFWMAATRFMKDLDIELVPDRNVASVDLFEARHARKVLAAYGRAYDALPQRSGELSRDQNAFLDEAVAGLAQDGRVVPVRLALFAEMVKGRPWTPATLREVGGMDGVGVKFLEDTFCSSRSHPNHRYHQRAAQAVLKSLLPEANADIKGRMRSVEELREASGYAGRPSDFADLLRTLDGELRLITPVDPEGSVEEGTAPAATKGRSFQLTHDYLVHALREWLTRKQRETRRGRAELLLAERASLWFAKPEDRYLPSVREWATIGLLTNRRDWNEPQRRMMKRAGRWIGLRGLGLAIVAGVLTATALNIYGASHAEGLVKRLESADISRVPAILAEIAKYRWWAEPQLRRIVSERPDDSKEKFHASLALLPIDPQQREYLQDRLLAASPTEMAAIRDCLEPHREAIADRLWEELRVARPVDTRILPLAATLARYYPEATEWADLGGKVAEMMVRAPIGELADWRVALQDIRRQLFRPLASILRDPQRRDEHAFAATLLSDYAADDPGRLLDLLLDADPKSFSILFRAVEERSHSYLADLREAIGAASPGAVMGEAPAKASEAAGLQAPPGGEIEGAKDRRAARGARAAVALIRLGCAKEVWPMLAYGRDPRARSALINALHAFGANPSLIAQELRRTAEAGPDIPPSGDKESYLFAEATSKRRALIQALVEYSAEALAPAERESLANAVVAFYREDRDAGVHSAAELLLRRWGFAKRLGLDPRPGPAPGEPIRRRWYVTKEGQTMVIIDGPVEFEMGSRASDPDRSDIEALHHRIIPRRFAIASKEISSLDFAAFAKELHVAIRQPKQKVRPDPAAPQGSVTWFEAARFCNWLSDKEGLPHCYVPNAKGEYAKDMTVDERAVARGGYRLPTEAEWEYACRAGTITIRYFGNSPELLPLYEWFVENSGYPQPCGRLLPNDLGLFDMLGNVSELCHDRYSEYRPDARGVIRDLIPGETVSIDRRCLRCESFNRYPSTLRSASRLAQFPDESWRDVGFRVARTIP
jgi:serine/threonine protein kinase/formylglycine-generating enzyme required for sulfatase activity